LDSEAQSVWLAELLPAETAAPEPPRLLYFSEPGVEPQRYELNPPAGWQVYQLLPHPIGNTLWFIGNLGFLSYNPAIDQWGVYELQTESLSVETTQQSEHLVWFVSNTQIGRFDTNTGTAEFNPLPTIAESPPALAITPDELWLLVNSTLYRSSSESLDWLPIALTAPCLDQAYQLTYWHENLWMGGFNGVGRLNTAVNQWRCYAPADGMLDLQFEQMVPTDNALWFAHSQRGLWRYQDS
jgi:hypothetical protein